MRRIAWWLLLVLGACAAAQQQKDLTSAADHRVEARQYDAAARKELQQIDSSAARAPTGAGPVVVELAGAYPVTPEDTPRLQHQERAWFEARDASEHREAARQLEASESAECRGSTGAERSACPTLGPVTTIKDIEHGARLDYRAGTDVIPIVARMRCHLAFARTRGYGAATACPLYQPGVDIRLSKDERSIELTADDGPGVVELRQHCREMVR